MPSSDQCAVGTDGKLLDESEIVWYNDAEDSVPIAPAASQVLPLVLSTSSMFKATTLHAFFDGASTPQPAVFVAGAHRSSHVSKPSKCILNVNNAELQAESSKCARIACKKPVQSESKDEASIAHASNVGNSLALLAHQYVCLAWMFCMYIFRRFLIMIGTRLPQSSLHPFPESTWISTSNAGGDTDVEMEDSTTAKDTYALTKAMGDQDRKVSAHHCDYPTMGLLIYPGLMYSVEVWSYGWCANHLQVWERACQCSYGWSQRWTRMHSLQVSAPFLFNQSVIINPSLTDGVQRDAGVSAKNCFFLGNITTLRNHISRFIHFS